MRVLFVIDSLAGGGAQRQLVELAATLAQQGRTKPAVLVYYGDGFFRERLESAGVPVYDVGRRGRFDFSFLARLRSTISDLSPDLVHVFMHAPAAWVWLATRGMRRRPPLVVAERVVLSAVAPLFLHLIRLVYRSADAVTANAACAALEIRERFGLGEGVHVIGNGIDLERWDALRSVGPPLALPDGTFRVAIIGGLRPQKNHRLLFDALVELGPERTQGWRVLVVGDETAGETAAMEIRRLVRERALTDRVSFVQATRNVSALMAGLDALVLASDYEGFPNVVLEAMAAGLPVVATDVGAVPDLVVHGETGLVVAKGDVAALAEALHRMASLSRAERDAMGARGRRIVEARYSMSHIASEYASVYDRVLAVRRRGTPRADAAR